MKNQEVKIVNQASFFTRKSCGALADKPGLSGLTSNLKSTTLFWYCICQLSPTWLAMSSNIVF